MNAADLPQCVPLITKDEIAAAGDRAVNCGRCDRLRARLPEGKGGYCLEFRAMKSAWHPVICNRFVKKE